MMLWLKKKFWFVLTAMGMLLLLAATPRSATSNPPARTTNIRPPEPEREFRALWLASVANIDWPSSTNLTASQQKAQLTSYFDRAVSLKFNAVILQVRCECDALYDSRYEPWSEYLTGQMGRSPGYSYDPLAFAVSEAHKRGLELHAWFNPYRVRRDRSMPVSPKHVSVTRPDLVRSYGKLLLLDPTSTATREYSLQVIMDVVRRYDIDGVHFDDYFYPSPESGQPPAALDAIDESNWRRYVSAGGRRPRADWRRDNVNQFVYQVYHSIKGEKPWVRFGVSPNGIWRSGNPAGVRGLSAYDDLYADTRGWLASGWVDYLAPQLYWPSGKKEQNFHDLLKWWNDQNTAGRAVWPGINQLNEAAEQLTLTRQLSKPSGVFFWPGHSVILNSNNVAPVLQKLYAQPALVPAMRWMSTNAPPIPTLWGSRNPASIRINWNSPRKDIARWVVQKKYGSRWETQIVPSEQKSLRLDAPLQLPEAITVRAADRYGNLSPAAVFVK